ncbi:MAG: hypothetical protein FI718_04925 [SAR202 cluster bacterium]|nr:hypothetical protein [SAR202 cluster bacterium]MQG39312.1 hypothetical protein [SAR202 cluster bacterium]
MEKNFQIQGMTCQSCANTIQDGLGKSSKIKSAKVVLETNQLTIISDEDFSSDEIDSMLSTLGNYNVKKTKKNLLSRIIIYLESRKPILVALFIVIISSLSLQTSYGTFDVNNWFTTYMGMFFVVFSFLKLLNVKGFSMTFKRYDVIAKRVPGFSLTYPFLELILGVAFLTKTLLLASNIITLILMVSQSIGVSIVLKRKQQIQCACLGSSINLPISFLTLLENILMIFMSAYMINQMI